MSRGPTHTCLRVDMYRWKKAPCAGVFILCAPIYLYVSIYINIYVRPPRSNGLSYCEICLCNLDQRRAPTMGTSNFMNGTAQCTRRINNRVRIVLCAQHNSQRETYTWYNNIMSECLNSIRMKRLLTFLKANTNSSTYKIRLRVLATRLN